MSRGCMNNIESLVSRFYKQEEKCVKEGAKLSLLEGKIIECAKKLKDFDDIHLIGVYVSGINLLVDKLPSITSSKTAKYKETYRVERVSFNFCEKDTYDRILKKGTLWQPNFGVLENMLKKLDTSNLVPVCIITLALYEYDTSLENRCVQQFNIISEQFKKFYRVY